MDQADQVRNASCLDQELGSHPNPDLYETDLKYFIYKDEFFLLLIYVNIFVFANKMDLRPVYSMRRAIGNVLSHTKKLASVLYCTVLPVQYCTVL